MNPDNLVGLRKTEAWRRYLMGPEILPKEDLAVAAKEIFDRIESNSKYSQFEELMHELAHHLTLRGHLRLRRRRLAIEDEIDRMGLAAQDGNELDTLAVELEALYWLGYPESQRQTANLTVIVLLKPRQINEMLTTLREYPEIQQWGVMLARAVQRRAKTNRKKAV